MAALSLRIESNGDGDPWIIEQRMFDVLDDFLQPFSAMSPTAAAAQLNLCFPLYRADDDDVRGESEGAGTGKEDSESFLWEMWGLILKVARQVPYRHPSQDRLAELIKALTDLPSDIKINIWGNERKLWQDLPLLHQEIMEVGHTFGPDQLHTGDGERERWQSFTAFIARLTRDKIQPEPLFAIWTLRDALEQEPDPRARAYHTQGPALDAQIPAAAEWIIVAGPVLYQFCQSEDEAERAASDATKGGRNFKGQGLSLERWNFWKQRFAQV
ncbi:hypothetical protein BS17DRAFT_638966, partial [Gyrodon lividus]